jgi:2-polyprenyl-3-methyl-5-hydroxy-6-metoxy-1,4-benzoquinol methylase
VGSVLRLIPAFFVWHFLLRRLGIRLETRRSARAFVACAAIVLSIRHRSVRLLALAAGATWFAITARTTQDHFDALAPDYAEQLSPAARARVLNRKTTLMVDALADAGLSRARMLDVGCGHGWYVGALEAQGVAVTGIDLSPAQLRAARAHLNGAARLASGSITDLPIRANAFDAVYAVNVLHHLETEASQAAALEQLSRATRPGGLVFLHEINTRNPLFRLYMSYVFPLWKRIDVGTERWLDPHRLPVSKNLTLQDVRYYTFLPDFSPVALTRALEPLEHRLEHAMPSWSAHFTAVYRRLPLA